LSFKSKSLGLSSKFLDLVFKVLFGLSASSDFGFFENTLLDESVFWLEFSQGVFGSIDESEGSGFVSTELGSQSEDDDLL
jgi:hypothetical protein